MRCKNCGSENDSNLYICQNCGSPLYDEDEAVTPQDSTQVFSTITEPSSTQKYIDDFEESQNRQRRSRAERYEPPVNDNKGGGNGKQIAIIVILVVVLIAVITATVFAISRAKSNAVTTSATTSTTESTTEEEEYETTNTTTSSTEAKYTINLIANDGGSVDGEGTYEKGKTVTIKARAYDGYTFDGWYIDGELESSDSSYTFKARRDVTLRAKFIKKKTTTEKKTTAEPTKEVPTEQPDVDIVE